VSWAAASRESGWLAPAALLDLAWLGAVGLAEEARASEGSGRCQLQEAHRDLGAGSLRQALAGCRRIGSASAQQVEETLRDHGL